MKCKKKYRFYRCSVRVCEFLKKKKTWVFQQNEVKFMKMYLFDEFSVKVVFSEKNIGFFSKQHCDVEG